MSQSMSHKSGKNALPRFPLSRYTVVKKIPHPNFPFFFMSHKSKTENCSKKSDFLKTRDNAMRASGHPRIGPTINSLGCVPNNYIIQYDYNTNYKGPYVVLVEGTSRVIDYVAVVDSQNPDRVFLGETIKTGNTHKALVGGICNFEDNGNMRGVIVPLPVELFDYDWRNGQTSWKTIFLCEDTSRPSRCNGRPVGIEGRWDSRQ